MKVPVTEILDQCREMAFAGKDYLDIKKHIASLNLDQEASNAILLKADEFLVKYQHYQQFHTRSIIGMMAGALLVLLGFSVNFFTTKKTTLYYTFTYVPILIGTRIFYKSLTNFRLSPNDMPDEETIKKGKFDRYIS